MGEIADMMLDGTMCQVCGEHNPDLLAHLEKHAPGGGECKVPWDPPGYPITCTGCGGDVMDSEPVNVKDPKTVACPDPVCERKFRNRNAAAQHWVDAHGETKG